MDHLQSNLESDHRQTDSSELPNVIEENKPMERSEATAEADPELKQFIQQELESMRNQEEAERDPKPKEKSSQMSVEQGLSTLVEKLPFERMINSTIKFFLNQKPKQEKKGKKSRKR